VSERKDRLVQTRVPERLESTLKEEARRRRTTVSQMIRAVLEDTFDLVDGVVANVDQIVSDSVALAKQVGRDARRIRGDGDAVRPPCHEPLPGAAERLDRVQAWNEVVLNRSVACTKCGAELTRGGRAFMAVETGAGVETGAHDDPTQPGAWLCDAAVAALAPEPEPALEAEPAGGDRHRLEEED